MRSANRAPMRIAAAATALLLLVSAAGCQTSRPPLGGSDPSETARQEARQTFAEAWLVKPVEASNEGGLPGLFAPLLVLETDPARGRPPNPPRVLWVEEQSLTIHQRPWPQLIYFWQSPGPRSREGAGRPATVWLAFRILLGTRGQPVLWELPGTEDQPSRLFVARHWEEAARQSFGPATPPRHFAAESDMPLSSPPRAVVVETFDDAPMPMGPIVHVSHQNRITALICRCSPVRVQRLSGQAWYELQPASASPRAAVTGGAASPPHLRWLTPDELEARLRWLPEL
ncbi:hypothetical protein [Limisphaera sp. VF-2]|uniref:hypothetical protein n=1 Tax=Limisphaera sp. VF-2 TaxID=3400418 RepID=UPI003C27FE2A